MKILDKLGPNACPALRFVRPTVVSGAAVAGETSQQPLRSSAANNQRRKSMLRAASVVGVLAAAWGIRFVLGMRTQLDADEATLGLASLHITQGHLVLTEPNDHYLGALEAYLLAPFVAIMGTTLAAIRAATATVGAAFVLASYALGRTIFHVHRRALILAGVSSVFPLFAVFWSTKARGGYAEALPLEAAALTLALAVGWTPLGRRARWWAALGLVLGVGLWNDVLSVVVVAVIAVALAVRARVIGWNVTLRGVGVAAVATAVGFSPWLLYNASHSFASIRALPIVASSLATRADALIHDQFPILIGGSRACGDDVVPTWLSNGAVILLAVATLWLRRRSLLALLHGHARALEPMDMTLLVAPAVIALLLATHAQVIPCEPRYLLLLAVPAAVAVTLLLVSGTPVRQLTAAAFAAWLAVSGIAAGGALIEMRSATPGGALIPFDLGPGLTMIEQQHPEAVWAQYWLSRPLSYFSGDTLVIGEYGGPVAFPERQAEAMDAADPSWVFVARDPHLINFEQACRQRDIAYTRLDGGGLVLFTNLTEPLTPGDRPFATPSG